MEWPCLKYNTSSNCTGDKIYDTLTAVRVSSCGVSPDLIAYCTFISFDAHKENARLY